MLFRSASIEFNKAEGVDAVDDAEPGDYIYFGISEFNDDLAGPSNEGGSVSLERVDGGVVYRAELEDGYDVSTLEPVVVGPDFTEEQAMADVDDALRNVDNVYALRDGRVICCEDGWRGGNRSYPNDGMYVYQPPESAQRLSQGGESDDGDDTNGNNEMPDDGNGEETAAADGAEGTATDAEGPGFGVLGGAAGVAGAGYLLKRGLDDEDAE